MTAWEGTGEILIAFFLVFGAALALVGSIGLVRMPDFFMRLHGPTKATTLGIGSMLTASFLFFLLRENTWSLHEILVTFFLFLTAPVSAHMMAKAALHLKVQGQKNPEEADDRTQGRSVPNGTPSHDDQVSQPPPDAIKP
ncbi:Na+/H+ antiporter subunit G [Desulfosoma sp.]